MNLQSLHDLSDCYAHEVPEGARRLAWDGISFCVPSNWELARYDFQRRGVTHIEVEDEYTVRMEAEWIRPRARLDLERIMKRYERASKPLTVKSDLRDDIGDLPPGWRATHFVFKETGSEKGKRGLVHIQHELVTAFYVDPKSPLFCFFILHFLPDDPEDPVAITRALAAAFKDHGGDPRRPWQLFDLAFALPQDFALRRASFDVGAKLLSFGWRRRRLHLWYFSCADVFLGEDTPPADWAVNYLNRNAGIKGVVFEVDGEGGIRTRGRRPHLFGHWDDIARACFRYDVRVRRLEEKNQLMISVYNYRKEEDLLEVGTRSAEGGIRRSL